MEQPPDSPAVATANPPLWFAFEPVPVRYRRDGWTPERQRLYVMGLVRWGDGRRAAALVGLSVQSAARLRRHRDAGSFTRACDLALRSGRRRRREAAARARAARTAGLFPAHGS